MAVATCFGDLRPRITGRLDPPSLFEPVQHSRRKPQGLDAGLDQVCFPQTGLLDRLDQSRFSRSARSGYGDHQWLELWVEQRRAVGRWPACEPAILRSADGEPAAQE